MFQKRGNGQGTAERVKTSLTIPYNPADMLKLYIYGYFNGIRTSRKLESECKRNIGELSN